MYPNQREARIKGRTSCVENIDLEKFSVAGTCESWSVYKLRQSHHLRTPCFLWNPDALQKIDLPNLPSWSYPTLRYRKCIITAPPRSSSQECLVLFLIQTSCKLLFCRPGDKNWNEWKYDKDEERHFLIHDAITCQGKVFALYGRGNLCEIVIGPQLFTLKHYNARLSPRYSEFHNDQLVDSCGELFVVRRKSISNIEVFKFDVSEDKLEQVFNLGVDRVFTFIGNYSISFSAADQQFGINGNTIVFKDEDDRQGLYSFNMVDMSLSVWIDHPNSGNLWTSHDDMMSMFRSPNEQEAGEDESFEYSSNDENDELENGSEGFQQLHEKMSEDESKSKWFQLPTEIQRLIIGQYLTSVYDWMNFRAVCKSWKSLVSPVQWFLDYRGFPFKYPWLVFPQGEGMYSFYDPIANWTRCNIKIPDLEGCKIRFSNQGWLLVTKAPASIFFFEPFTRTKIELPDLSENSRLEELDYCFSDTPTSSNWKIFGLSHPRQNHIRACYLQSCDEDWTLLSFDSESLPDPSFTNLVFNGQYFCYLGKHGNIIYFKIDETGFRHYIEGGSSSLPYKDKYWRQFLVCYKGELLSVFIDQRKELANVFKYDCVCKRKWVDVTKKLDKDILYLSSTNCLGVEAIMMPRIGNTIQFSMFSDIPDKCNGGNVSYSLKEKKLGIYNGNGGYSSIADLYNTKEFLFGTWIQPLAFPTCDV